MYNSAYSRPFLGSSANLTVLSGSSTNRNKPPTGLLGGGSSQTRLQLATTSFQFGARGSAREGFRPPAPFVQPVQIISSNPQQATAGHSHHHLGFNQPPIATPVTVVHTTTDKIAAVSSGSQPVTGTMEVPTGEVERTSFTFYRV